MNSKQQCRRRAQLVRLHETNCESEHPTAREGNPRIGVLEQFGREFGLPQLRTTAIAGPVLTAAARPAATLVRNR
jgi:hypothetical protein